MMTKMIRYLFILRPVPRYGTQSQTSAPSAAVHKGVMINPTQIKANEVMRRAAVRVALSNGVHAARSAAIDKREGGSQAAEPADLGPLRALVWFHFIVG